MGIDPALGLEPYLHSLTIPLFHLLSQSGLCLFWVLCVRAPFSFIYIILYLLVRDVQGTGVQDVDARLGYILYIYCISVYPTTDVCYPGIPF